MTVPAFRLQEATIATVHAAFTAGTLRCTELVDAYLERVEALDRSGPELNAIVSLCEEAGGRAAELDRELAERGELVGPLHGIPFLVKDCIETRDAPTSFGSAAARDFRSGTDAEVVRRLRAAGAVILAKSTMADFAASWFSFSSRSGDTKNPYALDRDSGGSSAGSAAGVAANLATVALGTDCGGSIRVPSSFNSLVGLRATTGLVPMDGCAELVKGQDVIGPIARTVADAARVAAVLAGAGSGLDAPLAPPALGAVRLGVLSEAFEGAGADGVGRIVRTALRRLGAPLVDVSVPDLSARLEATSRYLRQSADDIDAFLASRTALAHLKLQDLRAAGVYDRRLDLIDAIVDAQARGDQGPPSPREPFTAALVHVLDAHRLDAFAFPSVRALSPVRGAPAQFTTLTFPTNTLIASQSGLPAVTVPAGFTPGGFPVGLELVGRPRTERALLSLAAAVEAKLRARRPPPL